MFVLYCWHYFTIIYLTIQIVVIGSKANPIEEQSTLMMVMNDQSVPINITTESSNFSLETKNNNEHSEEIVTTTAYQFIEIFENDFVTTTTTELPNNENPHNDSTRICTGKFQVFRNCTNNCPASCEDIDRKPCGSFCWSGCECIPGYVRDHYWKCIPKEDCPKCGQNEHYRNCGSQCEPTCSTYQNALIYCNRINCKRGCFCNYGFVRDISQNGTCVPIQQCPNQCGENEYWDVHGEPCVRSANNPRPKCLFEKPKPGCVCNTGFKRDPNTKQCVPMTSRAIKCNQNETYSLCGSECAHHCFEDSKRIMCPTICERGCFCKDGYRREEHSGRCVLPHDCRHWSFDQYETPIIFA